MRRLTRHPRRPHARDRGVRKLRVDDRLGPRTAEFKTAFVAEKAQLKTLGEDVGTRCRRRPEEDRCG